MFKNRSQNLNVKLKTDKNSRQTFSHRVHGTCTVSLIVLVVTMNMLIYEISLTCLNLFIPEMTEIFI